MVGKYIFYKRFKFLPPAIIYYLDEFYSCKCGLNHYLLYLMYHPLDDFDMEIPTNSCLGLIYLLIMAMAMLPIQILCYLYSLFTLCINCCQTIVEVLRYEQKILENNKEENKQIEENNKEENISYV